MNILFVNSTRKWGGVKTWTLDVAQELSRLGHKSWIIGRPGPFTDKAKSLGIPTRTSSFGMDFSPLQILKFIFFCKKHRIDRVVVNVGKDMRTAGLAARILLIPVIHRVGLSGDMRDKWNVRFTQRYIQPHILAPCKQIKRDLPKVLPYLKSDDITVIHTGKIIAKTPTQTPSRPFRCISTSQINADKGHKDVLTALAHLKKQGIDFRYDVVGTGHEKARLQELAVNLGIDKHIVWHGFQKNVNAFLDKADVFILPSYREGLPNSLLEAMAKGLVCIARDVGGVEEVWPHWASEYMLPRKDGHNKLMRTLGKLLTLSAHELDTIKQQFLAHAATNCNLTTQVAILAQWMQALPLPHDACFHRHHYDQTR